MARFLSMARIVSTAGIGEFKKEFDLQLDALLGAAVPATAQPELAMLFISKLDPQCYAGMRTHLTNDATLGRAFPLTLHAAWSVASDWKTAERDADMQSVFMLADDMAGPPKNPKSAQGSKQAGRGQGRPSKQEQKQQPPASKPAAKPSQSRTAAAETRTCSGCYIEKQSRANLIPEESKAEAKAKRLANKLAKQAKSNQQVEEPIEQASDDADDVDDYPGDDLFNDDKIDDISGNISDQSYNL